MARSTRKPANKRRSRKKGLGDTDQPFVVVRNRKSAAETLFKKAGDDSVLKTAVVWVGAGFVAYYGTKLLMGSIGKQVQETRLAREETAAVTTTGTAAALAGQLKKAMSDWGNTDETVVFSVFDGKQIQTRQFFIEVANSYKLQTHGRILLDDLYNNMDSWAEPWKPDWNKVKVVIDKIMATDRNKLKPATKKKL